MSVEFSRRASILSLLYALFAFYVYSRFFDLAITPDEVAFKIITGRWAEQGATASGFHWLCYPNGITVPIFFWPAKIAASTWGWFIQHQPDFEREAKAAFLALTFGVSFYALAKRKQSLESLPVITAATCMGAIPVWMLLERPEGLWVIASLCLLSSINFKNHYLKRASWILAAALFYYGCSIHRSFLLLSPTLLISCLAVFQSRLSKGLSLACISIIVVFSAFHTDLMISCPALPLIQQALNRLSSPTLEGFDKIGIGLLVDPTSFSLGSHELDILPAIPSSMIQIISLAFQRIALIIMYTFILYSWVFSSKRAIDAAIATFRGGPHLSKFSQLQIVNLSFASALTTVLIISLLDPLHQGYRIAAGLVVGTFCSVSINHEKPLFLRSHRKAERFIRLLLSLLFTVALMTSIYYAETHIKKKFGEGFAGPSVARKDWIKNFSNTPSQIQELKLSSSPDRIIIDDYTYPWTTSSYKQLIPFTYLGWAVDHGVSPAYVNTTLKGTHFVVRCGNNYVRILDLKGKGRSEGLIERFPVEGGEDICIGKVE